jgi:ABC-2 type transport system permease protein
MTGAIARNTIRQATRSGAVPVCGIVITALLVLAAFAGWRHQHEAEARRAYFANSVRTNWLSQPDRHPHRVSHYGYLAFRPRSALSYFDPGIENYAGTTVFLEAHRQNPANLSEAGQSAATSRLGELTPALVLQLLAPLLVFFLGHASVSGERENGTFALILAQGVSSRAVILGKAAGLVILTAVILLPGLVAAVVLTGSVHPESLGRFTLMVSVYVLYLAACSLLAVAVSAWQTTSRASLTALLLVWVLGWIAMPRALQAWGEARAPLPSRAAFDAAIEADLEQEGDGHNENDPHFAAFRARTLTQYRVSRIEDLPFNYSALVMKEAEEIGSAIFRRHYGRLLALFRRQSEPLVWGSFVSPYLAVRRVSSALAGSDLRHYAEFQQQAEEFRFTMIQKLNDLHMTEVSASNDKTTRLSRELWQSFPAFEFVPPGFGQLLPDILSPVAAMMAWAVLLAWAMVTRTAL